ncbi:MAG TPA: zf-HC2 domain-containing protein [Gemmatimonas sp.]|nr:zf-HC2 domain-containing protein [Gemmatimonas sp.]
MTNTSDTDSDVAVFDCRETVRRLWDYLDHQLSDAEVREVDAHLAHCEQCPPHFTYERAFLDAVRAARAERGANARLRERVRGMLGLDRPDVNETPRAAGRADD